MSPTLRERISGASGPERSVATIAERLYPSFSSTGLRTWFAPILVALFAGVIRFVNLGTPNAVVFDETYYAKDAWSLLRFGVEHKAVEEHDTIMLAAGDNWRNVAGFTSEGSFVVHPPTGKWVIASGEYLFGVSPFGWRFAVALLGTLSVLMIARIVRRMTRSDLIGAIAGLLLALDGIHIVLSRTALLDMVLSACVLAGFGALVLDRDRTRRRLASLGAKSGESWTLMSQGFGPGLGGRPWRLLSIVFLALAVSVKWSALWFIAIFMLLSLFWDVSTRRTVGAKRPWLGTLAKSTPIVVATSMGILIVVYLLSWSGWFLGTTGWGRNWAASQEPSIVPNALRSLFDYHRQAWNFHVTLDSEHSYQSNPISWPLMTRPTSFYYESIKDGSLGCPTDHCAQEVLALGNPLIWWAALLAIPYQLWNWITTRDWRSGAILAGIAAGWLPWMLYLNRTIFTFYTVIYVPFVVMAVALTIMKILQRKPPQQQRVVVALVALYLIAVIAAAWWFYPIWTGEVIPYDQWRLRMWMPSWV
ncbi:MAG: phospholipid carrier-dependent glycosyltransferase [Actinomycetia bacterium]|nr:phospholipid carrier-dependent glycosyltransferase [Actinomycetes bacterium]